MTGVDFADRKERVDMGRQMMGAFLLGHLKDPREKRTAASMAKDIGITRNTLDAMMRARPVVRRAGEKAARWMGIDQSWFAVDFWPLRPRGTPAKAKGRLA